MERLVGFLNFNDSFEEVYEPQMTENDGEQVLDLARAYQRQRQQIDHGRDPIRNGFIIELAKLDSRYSF